MISNPDTYRPAWCYTPANDGVVWRIMFAEPDMVVCENRVRDSGRPFYSCLLRSSGKEVLSNYVPGEREDDMSGLWHMTGLETTRETLFYIHGYEEGSPEHKGILAVDPMKAAAAWIRPEASFVANLPDGMLVYASGSFAGFPEKSYYLLDRTSGEVIDAVGQDPQKVNLLRARALSDEALQGVVLPSLTGSGNMMLQEQPEELAEYIEYDGWYATVKHASAGEGKGYDATFRLYRNGLEVYTDIMAMGTSVPCMNYFLLQGVTLYYIRNRTELVALRF